MESLGRLMEIHKCRVREGYEPPPPRSEEEQKLAVQRMSSRFENGRDLWDSGELTGKYRNHWRRLQAGLAEDPSDPY